MDKEDNNSSSLLASWGSRGEEHSFQPASSNGYYLISASVSSSLTPRQVSPLAGTREAPVVQWARCQPPHSVCDLLLWTAINILPQSQPNILDTSSVPSHAAGTSHNTVREELLPHPPILQMGILRHRTVTCPDSMPPTKTAIWPLDTIG